MCTVTFVPTPQGILFTSNRDEKNSRSNAVLPAVYPFDSGKILFPKDVDASGSWIAVHENGNALVLLNGAFTSHVSKPPYRKSRGVILLDMIDSSSPYNSFQAINLNKIEPFTTIIWENGHLFECRWDGKQKHHQLLEHEHPHIWSSVTLYDQAVIEKRKSWFEKWILENPAPSQEQVIHFHHFTGDGDEKNDLRMNREGKVFTVSITSLALGAHAALLHYLDLKQDLTSTESLPFEKSMAGNDE